MGKGSNRRPCLVPQEQFATNWDAAFGKQEADPLNKRKKPFGIEQYNEHYRKWMYRQWFATERGRDDALADFRKKTLLHSNQRTITDIRKIDR
jgi:hypothetical protein